MGKRKNNDCDYIKKKIRKLEKKLEKNRRKRRESETETEDERASPPFSPPPLHRSLTPTPLSPVKLPSPLTLHEPQTDKIQDIGTEVELPEELLQALGTEGEDITDVGEAIRPELTLRWTKIMQTGLGKEPREAILKKYPPPVNFPRSVAPIMNAEILASLSELSQKRDKRICDRQNITGRLMTCLGKSLSNILTGNINSKILVEEINDAAKLAAEIFHQDSTSRRFFALAGTNKTIQEAVRTSVPDEYLFGTDCGEKIKAAQSIQKTGTLIKNSANRVYKSGAIMKKQVNWRGPPQYHQQQRARGGPQQQQSSARQPNREQLRRTTKKTTTNQHRAKSRYRK